jgi:hypothetical protein
MTSLEAKRLLLAYRPGAGHELEPEMAMALRQAQTDPELGAWLQEHIAFQNRVRAELRATPPPADLKDRILAGRKIIRPVWKRREWLLAAACLALGLVIFGVISREPAGDQSFVAYRSRMVGYALRLYGMDIVTNDLEQVRRYLQSHGAPADYVLTPGLQATPVKGGARLSFNNVPVSMVCFDLAADRVLYMFVIDAAAIQDGKLPGPTPVLTSAHGIMTASWRRGGRLYLVAAAAEANVMEKLIRTTLRRPANAPALVVSPTRQTCPTSPTYPIRSGSPRLRLRVYSSSSA